MQSIITIKITLNTVFFLLIFTLILDSFIRKIKPEICILLMETEIWPNLIHILKKKIYLQHSSMRVYQKSHFKDMTRYSAKLSQVTLKQPKFDLLAKFIFI